MDSPQSKPGLYTARTDFPSPDFSLVPDDVQQLSLDRIRQGIDLPDIILLDGTRNPESALEALRSIVERSDSPRPLTLFIACHDSLQIGEQALRLGASDVICDPFPRIQYERKLEQLQMIVGLEREQEESRDKLRIFFNETMDGLVLANPDGDLLSMNPAFCNMTGYTESELQNKSFIDITHPDDVARELELVGRLVAGEIEHYTIEKRYVKKDGSFLPVQVNISAFRDKKGEIRFFMGIAEDITRRKLAEEALRESEEKLRIIFENSSVGIVLAHADGRTYSTNPAFEKITGYAAAELKDLHFRTLTHPEDYELEAPLLSKLVRGEINQYTLEKRYIRKGGDIIWVRIHIQALRDGTTGEILFFVGVIEDITERIHSDMALKENERAMRTLNRKLLQFIETNPMGFLEMDLDSRILEWNRSAEEMFGFTREEVLGKRALDILIPGEEREEVGNVAHNIRENKGGTHHVNKNLTRDGRTLICDWYNTPLHDDTGRVYGWASLVQDITDQVEAQKEIQRFNREMAHVTANLGRTRERLEATLLEEQERKKELENLVVLRERFLEIIAHDLKNPVYAIASLAGDMKDEWKELPEEEQLSLVGLIERAANRTAGLLENLLKWARIHSGKIEFLPTGLPVNDLIRESIANLHGQANAKKIEIEFAEGSESTASGDSAERGRGAGNEIYVYADRNMVETVLRNLISNAIKFSPQGGKIQLRIERENNQVRISVKDSGVGIPEELLGSLFQYDRKTVRPGTEGEQGTGMGLLLCREFVEKNGGVIRADSRENEGSVFSFTLPVPGNRGA